MDFAPEPVLDAFAPPPTRAAPRALAADDNGQTFSDHLDAANEQPPERSAQAPDEARPEATPTEADDTETSDGRFDPAIALLGGPLPAPAPTPMAAPIALQIATSAQQGTQLPDTESVTAPQAPPLAESAMQAEAAAPAAPSTPTEGKPTEAEARSAADVTQAPPTQTPQQQQTPAAPVENQNLPLEAQQAIAQTIAPEQQAAQPSGLQVIAKDAAKPVNTDAAPETHDGKADSALATKNTKSHAPKAVTNGNAVTDPSAQLSQSPGNAPDSPQMTQSSAATTTASQASTHVQHAALDSGAQRAAPAAAQVSREIIRRFTGGSTNFELRLDPPELGRVEVRMEVTRDNRVTAVVAADNPQALTELMRHARDLEQQLQSAGLQLSDNGLSFDLRQGAQGGEPDSEAASARNSAEEAANEQPQRTLARPIGIDRWRGVRIDMMV